MSYKVIIIGAGVSGMTAALYLKRAGVSCCIIEKNVPGGQINYTSTIENYPGNPNILGPDLAFNIYNQLTSLKVPFLFEEVIEIKDQENQKVVITKDSEITGQYIIIATGRSPRKLEVENEIILQGKGISYCAICDGPLYKGKEVVVVGGGDSALKEAEYLSNICKKVTLIHRRDEFRSKENKDELRQRKNIKILYQEEVGSFIGKEKLEAIKLKSGKKILCDACFIFIGYTPKTEMLESLNITNKDGYIKTDHQCRTKIKNIYAIGDVREKNIFQIITAMSDAVETALEIIELNSN